MDTDGEFVVGKRRAGLELIVSLVTRLRNQNVFNFLAAVLSILALGSCLFNSGVYFL